MNHNDKSALAAFMNGGISESIATEPPPPTDEQVKEAESLDIRRTPWPSCHYCKSPIINGWHLKGMCNAEQQSANSIKPMTDSEILAHEKFEDELKDAIDAGASLEQLNEIFDREVRCRRGDKTEKVKADIKRWDKYWLDNITKRVAELESEKEMTRRDINASLIAIQDYEEKARAKLLAECVAMLDVNIKNCHERFDTLQDHINTVDARLYLCEKVYEFKKDFQPLTAPIQDVSREELRKIYPNVNITESYQTISKGTPHKCPVCEGKGFSSCVRKASDGLEIDGILVEKDEKFLHTEACTPCEGKGIVWG